jgi:aspartyl-tRNA(Asn)/glutamyl-tRNA(Gln) amidotransferase subunit A
MLPLAFGTDTGGSIRIPAAFCGVSGIKPTYGRVPRTGVASLSWSLDHVGPLARSVDDLTLALGVIGGPDGIDPTAAPSQVPVADLGEINGLRIGVPTQWFFDEVDSEVHRCFKDATAVLEDLGARFVPVDLGAIEPIHREAWILFYCELASNQEERRHLRDGFDEGTLARLDCGFVPSAVDYLRVLRRRPVVQRAFREAMDALDLGLLMTPGPGAASPSLRDLTQSVNGTPLHFHRVTPRNMRIFDYTGMPALSLPAGFAQGMPCAVQLAGRHWDDGLVLAVGSAFQRATRFHLASPGD